MITFGMCESCRYHDVLRPALFTNDAFMICNSCESPYTVIVVSSVPPSKIADEVFKQMKHIRGAV